MAELLLMTICHIRPHAVLGCFFVVKNIIIIILIFTIEKTISQMNDTSEPGLFACQSGKDLTDAKTKSMEEKHLCPEPGNKHEPEMLWKASLSPQRPLTLETNPLILATPAQRNLGPNSNFHLDLPSPLLPAALNALKNQLEPISPLRSPTESSEKERQKQSNCIEENLMSEMPHRLSFGLLKAPVNDESPVAPENQVDKTQSVAQGNTVKSAVPVPTVDEPNPVDSGTEFFI